MSDTEAVGSSEPTPSFDELVEAAVASAHGRYGYIDETGVYDSTPLADKLLPFVAGAVATKTSERATVCIRRRGLVAHAYPDVPGPEAWAEQEDPLLAEAVYLRVDGCCWRLTSINPNGKLQQRLNGEHAVVLVRTKVNPDQTPAVYVTRDRGCLVEDIIKPQNATQMKRANNEAALMEMLIQRIPEHGPRFHRDLKGGLTRATNSALAITEAAVEALDGVDDDDQSVEDAD